MTTNFAYSHLREVALTQVGRGDVGRPFLKAVIDGAQAWDGSTVADDDEVKRIVASKEADAEAQSVLCVMKQRRVEWIECFARRLQRIGLKIAIEGPDANISCESIDPPSELVDRMARDFDIIDYPDENYAAATRITSITPVGEKVGEVEIFRVDGFLPIMEGRPYTEFAALKGVYTCGGWSVRRVVDFGIERRYMPEDRYLKLHVARRLDPRFPFSTRPADFPLIRDTARKAANVAKEINRLLPAWRDYQRGKAEIDKLLEDEAAVREAEEHQLPDWAANILTDNVRASISP